MDFNTNNVIDTVGEIAMSLEKTISILSIYGAFIEEDKPEIGASIEEHLCFLVNMNHYNVVLNCAWNFAQDSLEKCFAIENAYSQHIQANKPTEPTGTTPTA